VGASTNAMEISQEVERAQLSPMVHVGHASEVTGGMEDLALANHANVQVAEVFAVIEENKCCAKISTQDVQQTWFQSDFTK